MTTSPRLTVDRVTPVNHPGSQPGIALVEGALTQPSGTTWGPFATSPDQMAMVWNRYDGVVPALGDFPALGSSRPLVQTSLDDGSTDLLLGSDCTGGWLLFGKGADVQVAYDALIHYMERGLGVHEDASLSSDDYEEILSKEPLVLSWSFDDGTRLVLAAIELEDFPVPEEYEDGEWSGASLPPSPGVLAYPYGASCNDFTALELAEKPLMTALGAVPQLLSQNPKLKRYWSEFEIGKPILEVGGKPVDPVRDAPLLQALAVHLWKDVLGLERWSQTEDGVEKRAAEQLHRWAATNRPTSSPHGP